jgi:hypothetical protein
VYNISYLFYFITGCVTTFYIEKINNSDNINEEEIGVLLANWDVSEDELENSDDENLIEDENLDDNENYLDI